ncbi:MAG TPA: Txe/YoeB family addiction module toxin [Anaerovoracaceae bacterium]|nr:Txe/YoeB family addiction module toxin [Anaerovoracaceae bacterium]
MSNYVVRLSKRASKDRVKLMQAELSQKAKDLIDILAENPYQSPPAYEKLIGSLIRTYSRRINIRHRMVYSVHEDTKTVVVRSMWTHYE